MSKSILLIGFQYDSNLGDQVLYLVSRLYLSEILDELGLAQINILEADMTGREYFGINPTRDNVEKRLSFRLFRKMLNNKKLASQILDKLVVRKYISKCVNKNTIAIIIAGGGMIKYKVQNIPIYLDEILKIADQKSIPVMLSSVGVEGFDQKDKRCVKLKKAINRNVVKYISTRDDIDTLTSCYCNNGQITACVADPACAINKIYPMGKKNDNGAKLIGLGLARGDLFLDYGIQISEEDLFKLWSKIYKELQERGYRCKVFCNGAKSDYRFIECWADYMGFTNRQKEMILLKRPETAEDLIQTIGAFDGIIAVRLHAGIIAYSYSIPFVELVWNAKQKFFGEKIGCADRFIEKKDMSSDYIICALEQAIRTGYDESNKESYCKSTKSLMRKFVQEYVVPSFTVE